MIKLKISFVGRFSSQGNNMKIFVNNIRFIKISKSSLIVNIAGFKILNIHFLLHLF